jgi:hypothetical protein
MQARGRRLMCVSPLANCMDTYEAADFTARHKEAERGSSCKCWLVAPTMGSVQGWTIFLVLVPRRHGCTSCVAAPALMILHICWLPAGTAHWCARLHTGQHTRPSVKSRSTDSSSRQAHQSVWHPQLLQQR